MSTVRFNTECRPVPDLVQFTTMASSDNEKQKKQEVTLDCEQIQSEASRGRSRSERMRDKTLEELAEWMDFDYYTRYTERLMREWGNERAMGGQLDLQ